MKLKLQNYEHNTNLNLIQFIYLFLTKLNLEHNTLTWYGEPKCDVDRNRSLGDITAIYQTYYPTCTMQEVKEILLDFGEDLVGMYCSGIKKRVYQLLETKPGWRAYGYGIPDSKVEYDEYNEKILYRQENKNKQWLSI
jgi:hypothetical protein